MGEWQKVVGENGENTINKILDIAGWHTRSNNEDISCMNGSKHLGQKGNPKKTHGIDIIYHTESELISRHLDIAVISVKHTTSEYLKNPRNKVKEYFSDLISTINCFNFSEQKSEIRQGYKSVDFDRTVGILFWLSSNPKTYSNVVEKVKKIDVIKGEKYDLLTLIDNKKAKFIVDADSYVKRKHPNKGINYCYFKTGFHHDGLKVSSCGKSLPVYWLSSEIIPYKVVDNASNENSLVIIFDSEVSESNLTRLIGLAQDLSSSWANKTYIVARGYNQTLHRDMINTVKRKFRDKSFVETVIFDSIDLNIHNLE